MSLSTLFGAILIVRSSQDQISKVISLVAESDVLKASGGPLSRTARLGSDGQLVLDNLKNVLNTFKQWGEEKNGDDLIQNFFVSQDLLAVTAIPVTMTSMLGPLVPEVPALLQLLASLHSFRVVVNIWLITIVQRRSRRPRRRCKHPKEGVIS